MSSLMRVHSTNPTQMVSLRCLTHQFKSIAKQNEMMSMVSTIREVMKTPLLWNPTHHHLLSIIDIKKGGEPKLLHLLTPQQFGDQTKSRVHDFSLMALYHKIINFTKAGYNKLKTRETN
jgi:hypothetical protein